MRKRLELTEDERKVHIRNLHTENCRRQREKQRLLGYKKLVEAILGLYTIDNLSVDEIALKMANNGQFRVIIDKSLLNPSEEKSHKKC